MSDTLPDDPEIASPIRAAIGEAVRQRLSRNPMVTRLPTDKAEMFLRHGLMNPKECEEMIALIDGEAQPSKLFSGSANADYRTSWSCNMRIENPLVATVTKRIDTLMGIDPSWGELLQGQRYHPGQEYRVHCDYFPPRVHYWPVMRKCGGQRVWTTMVYLCDVEEGGETEFPRIGIKVPPRRGTLLIWNNMRPDGSPNGETVHAALPVVRGAKYVLTHWFRERPWSSTPIP